MRTTMTTAHNGSPTRPGPCPELRGAPAPAPVVAAGDAARATAGSATDHAAATTAATRRLASPRWLRERIDDDPRKPCDDGHQPARDQPAVRPGRALPARRQEPHRLGGLERGDDQRPPEPWPQH